ncbi:MAG: twin-arginine translocation signal domain-containing protein [bacterium]|nr:twin-arginine translocation signal domain-containing protein [bacterium]
MGEGKMDKPANFSPDRRKFLEAAITTGVGVGAIAANAMIPGQAQAGIIDTLLGRENIEDLADKMHGTNYYMAHTNDELKGNLKRLQLEVGDKMRSGGYDKFKKLGERGRAQKVDQDPIFRERESILAKFDPTLIPQLLVTYIQRGVMDKSLVKVYEQLGGDVEKVRKQGAGGVDPAIVGRIVSKITYTLGSGPRDYGIADPNVLSFEEKPKDVMTKR